MASKTMNQTFFTFIFTLYLPKQRYQTAIWPNWTIFGILLKRDSGNDKKRIPAEYQEARRNDIMTLGVRYPNKKRFFKILFFFAVTILTIATLRLSLGALLKQEVILNATLLF